MSEKDFQTVYSTLFSLSINEELLQGLQGLMAERNDKYNYNKASNALTSCTAVKKGLLRSITKAYDFFMLEVDEQTRVQNLIQQIKNERLC